MNFALVLGAGIGVGLLLVMSGLIPARPPLAVALARLHQPRASHVAADTSSFLVRLVGRPLARTTIGRSLVQRCRHDLRVTGRSSDELVAKQATTALIGLLWAPAIVAIMAMGGVHASLVLPVWSSLLLAVGGWLLPVVNLKVTANQRRRSFRHAFSCFLDLVAVRLAGGAGVESALTDSAHAGGGWAFSELRHALAEARFMGEPPWAGLDRLGTGLAIKELNELAASVTLAGDEGARVRASIAAKARAIRTRGLADAEAAAQSASERMSLPIVMLMVGFIVFLGYPAVTQVLTGL